MLLPYLREQNYLKKVDLYKKLSNFDIEKNILPKLLKDVYDLLKKSYKPLRSLMSFWRNAFKSSGF